MFVFLVFFMWGGKKSFERLCFCSLCWILTFIIVLLFLYDCFFLVLCVFLSKYYFVTLLLLLTMKRLYANKRQKRSRANLMDIKQLRIGIIQELRLLRSQGYKWVHRDTHIYTHTCINYTYTHMTSTYHIRFVFLCTFFRFFFLVLFSHFSRPTMFCYCCCLNNCNWTEKSQYLTKETE